MGCKTRSCTPTRSAVLSRVLGDPSGGFNKRLMNPVDPVVAARCLCNIAQMKRIKSMKRQTLWIRLMTDNAV